MKNSFTSNINSKVFAPEGIVAINKDKKIILFNEAAGRITGFQIREVISKSIGFLFTGTDKKNDLIKRSLSSDEIYSNIPLTINCADGKKLPVTASITPLTQPVQGIIGIIITFRDTQEILSLYGLIDEKNNEIIEEKNKFETIFHSLLEGTFTINANWEITSFNKAAEEITGFSIAEAVGKKYWQVFPSEEGKEDPQLRAFISEHQKALLREMTIIRKNGSRVLVRINSAPLLDISGNKIGRVVTFEDISLERNLSQHIEERFHFNNIIGHSKPMINVFNMMENVIHTDSTVLITGESGTGKEVIARAIHLNSERKSEPFIALNCTAFAETLLESELFGHEKGAFTGAIHTKPGRFELSGNGTLFLDEIGDIPLTVQVKLLRVLENRQYERVGGTRSLSLKARIVSATHRNLELEIKEGRFREDLYYRINVINIHLPSLYERKDDIPSLVNYFMDKYNKKFKKEIHYISPEAFRIFFHYRWPGNIRELDNVIEHAFVVCNSDAITVEHLPLKLQEVNNEAALNDNSRSTNPLEAAEKQSLIDTLHKFNGNRAKTAEALGINKTTLWRKMKKYNLKL